MELITGLVGKMEDTKELITTDDIRSKVYIIRGQQVMLDKDLAEIYGYEVKRLNEQVKRNISRFPEDFMFQLNKEEIPEGFSKSQFATLHEKSNRQGSNIKKMPFAFALSYQGMKGHHYGWDTMDFNDNVRKDFNYG